MIPIYSTTVLYDNIVLRICQIKNKAMYNTKFLTGEYLMAFSFGCQIEQQEYRESNCSLCLLSVCAKR